MNTTKHGPLWEDWEIISLHFLSVILSEYLTLFDLCHQKLTFFAFHPILQILAATTLNFHF